jgi:hypothetical protein
MGRGRDGSPGWLPPIPLLAIELRRRGFVEGSVVDASRHPLCGSRPAGTWMTSGLDDQPARMGVEFDFFRKVGFIEQRVGIRIPRESPILTMRVFVGIVITV